MSSKEAFKGLLLVIALLIAPIASSANDTPSCSEEVVQELVQNIIRDELKRVLVLQDSVYVTGIHPNSPYAPSYEQIIQSTDPEFRRLVADVEAKIARVTLQLNSIRTTDRHDHISKVFCAAAVEIQVPGRSQRSFTQYSAQYEEGYVYVEVFE